MMQPVLSQWRAFEPNLSEGLKAIGEAADTCAESQRKLIENQKQNLTVVIRLSRSLLAVIRLKRSPVSLYMSMGYILKLLKKLCEIAITHKWIMKYTWSNCVA